MGFLMATAVSRQDSSTKKWSTEQVQRLFEAVRSSPGTVGDIPSASFWKALLAVMFDTGASIPHVMKVRRSEFDPKGGLLCVRAKEYRLHAKTVTAIEAILPHQAVELFPWSAESTPGGVFFRSLEELLSRAGIPLPKDNAFQFLKKVANGSIGLLDRLDLSKPPILPTVVHPVKASPTFGDSAVHVSDVPQSNPITINRSLEGVPKGEFRLSEAWERLILPDRDKAKESTLAEYRDVLNIWRRLTGDPAVSEITRRVVTDFRDKLISTPYIIGKTSKPRSVGTVNRIMRDLHVMISPLFPADRYYPAGIGVTPIFKFPKALPQKKLAPFVFTENQLSRLYIQADACRQTYGCRETGLNSPRLWRTGLVLALNCAARTFDLFNLRWDDVLLGESGRFRYGSIQFEAKKTGKFQTIPLNFCAAQHLTDLSKRPFDDSDRVFPGFHKGKPFYNTWRRICAAAEVGAVFEDMRKTAVTWHNSLVWQAGFWLSGHVEPGVFGNYDNPSERIFEAVYRLENPKAFVQGGNSLRTPEGFRPITERR
jgi:integrase